MVDVWTILNLTPDSFYNESRVGGKNFLQKALAALEQGSDVLDIGAESTRPGGKILSPQEEWQRLSEPLQELRKQLGDKDFFNRVSIDTRNPSTIKKVLELGVGTINDQSGGCPETFSAVAKHNAQIVLMHSTALPVDPSQKVEYNDVVQDVFAFLTEQSEFAIAAGVLPENIIWDYGIGFGKNLEQNLQLLAASKKFMQDYRLLIGISRKSFLHHLLNIPEPADRLLPTTIVSTYLALQGVNILRTHDTEAVVQMNTLLEALDKT